MNSGQVITVVAFVVFISAVMLTWFAIDVGTTAMARYRADFTQRAGFQVQEFFLFIDPRSLFMANLAVMALGGLAVWMVTGSVLVALPAFFGLTMLPRALYAWFKKRRQHKFEEQLPDALMMLCGGLRAGVGMNAALAQLVAEAKAPLAQEFTLLLREQRLGVSLDQSLSNLSRRIPTQATTLVISAMRVATETGGGLAETLERTAHTIRSRLQMEGKIGALTAQGKLQAWVVGLLPVAMMAVLNKMEPEPMGMLWHSRIGWATLFVIGFLECMGIYVIRKITAIDV